MIKYTKERETERSRLFFDAMGVDDDGRRKPCMTKAEFQAFNKPCREPKANELNGKTLVEVYFELELYYNVSYVYCFETDTVYECCLYISDWDD